MSSRQQRAFNTLRRLTPERTPRERCDVCSVFLPEDHAHLVEPASRRLICACAACLVSAGNQVGTPYRRVPRHVHFLPDFRLTDSQWDSLAIPVGMAFFFYSTPASRVIAFYPSPAGATESLLNLEAWTEVVRDNPMLDTIQPDVEALLVNHLAVTHEYYLAPIDRCYELVGLMRAGWRGLNGGAEVWEQIGQFYARLREQSSVPREQSHA